MEKTVLTLPDGTVLTSGPEESHAIQAVTWTQCVNDGQELTPGSVCAACLEVKLYSPGGLEIGCGTELTYYCVDASGVQRKVGSFLCQKPERPSRNTYTITAYDSVSKLDKDLTQWLAGLTQWPYSLESFAAMVCTACGTELAAGELPNGGYLVRQFSAQGLTGRQVMSWIGQLAGRFCRATVEGKIEFGWYGETDTHIAPQGEQYYFQGGLSYADYAVAPIEKVQLQQNEEDVGTVYPQLAAEANTCRITGNLLLTAHTGEELQPVAQILYENLAGLTYTPGSIQLPATAGVRAGDIFTVTEPEGSTLTMYAMTVERKGSRLEVSCTGSPRRDSSAAVNTRSYKALEGKVLNLRTDVDGLRAENRDMAGNAAQLSLALEGMSATVTTQEGKLSTLEQSADRVWLSVQQVGQAVTALEENGVSQVRTGKNYTFNDAGLTIQEPGKEMENRLDHTGMYVKRSGEVILQANNQGVVATDVTVRNYLMVGNARFEEYKNGADGKRTACFYMEEGTNGT